MSTPRLDQPPATNGRRRAPFVELPPGAGGALRRGLAVALSAAVLGAGAITGLLFATGAVGTTTKVTTVTGTASPGAAAGFDPAALYANANPGVVDITAKGVSSSSNGSPFAPAGTTVATGTGFVADARGHIVTAAHVVAGASSITVNLQDGTRKTATVAGVDNSTDVAVLKIDPSGLTLHPLPLGTTHALAVGDRLAVIGDPFGYDRSLSSGVVSALDRTIQAPSGFTVPHTIQTNAAINPGNSGGPVLDARGDVVGVVDQIATGGSNVDSSTGVGFAVPIDVVKRELPQLERGVRVTHAYLGIATAQGTSQGARVASVDPAGPASAAGLRVGDRLTAIDGTAVRGPNGFVAAVAAHRPGDHITLTVQRGATSLTLTATLGTQPSSASAG